MRTTRLCDIHICGFVTTQLRVQIYAMRQKQREKEAARTDVSQIAVDEKSMHKTAEVAAQEAAAESRTRDTEKVAMKLHTKRKAALVSDYFTCSQNTRKRACAHKIWCLRIVLLVFPGTVW